MATITVKGRTLDVTGLTPKQIDRVRYMAQDSKYRKVEALAESFRAKNQAADPSPDPSVEPDPTVEPDPNPGRAPGAEPDPNLGINPKTGKIDPTTATTTVTNAVANDTSKTFGMQNPGSQTDASGNSQKISFDPETGAVQITQDAGAGLSAANTAFTNAAMGFGEGNPFENARNASYSYLTQDYGNQKQMEMEAAKQQLAERGIPIDMNDGSLWRKTIDAIDGKYQKLDDQAKNQSWGMGNQAAATQAGVVGTLSGAAAAQRPNFTPYQGGQSQQGETLLSLLSTISAADMAKYGIDKDVMVKLKQIAASRPSGGGGGGGGTDTSPIIGGVAPGFNI